MSESSNVLQRVVFVVAIGATAQACGGSSSPPTADAATADAPAADVATADVPGTDVANADVPGTDVANADVPGTDVAPVDVPGTDVANADVPGTDVAPVDVPGTDVAPVDVPGMDVAPVDVSPVDVPSVDVAVGDTGAPDAGSVAHTLRIRSLSPSSATAGDMGFTLTVRGVGFAPDSTLTWAGAPRPVTYVNATTLRVAVSSSDLATATSATLVVTNPSQGGASARSTFAVYRPFATRTWLPSSRFTTADGWFSATTRERVWLADIDADGISDVVGLDPDGNVWVSRGTGTEFTASARVGSATVFRIAAGWFENSSQPRVWLTDVTGDGRADLVGLDLTGGLWVSESTGTSFNASRNVAATTFLTSAGYFANTDHPHVFLGDLNADGKTDLLGIHPSTGRVGVALATGSGSSASFQADATFLTASSLTTPADWFRTTTAPRLFLGDITGDRRADLVGLAINGDLYVAESTGTTMNAPRRVGNTIFSDANGWFAVPQQPRIALADFNGDGKLDLVGVGAPAVGDGDIWALEATGSGTAADMQQRVLLHGSQFRTGDGWFSPSARPSVWFTDATGDGRADVLGVDPSGGVWVARSVGERSSAGVDPARTHDFFLPATRNGDSGLTPTNFFSTTSHRRVWVADVTGDGARDLVAISPTGGSDGDILWRMSAPAMVRSITPVTRQMLTSGAPQQVEVTLSRRVDPTRFDPAALRVAVNDRAVAPTAVTPATRGARFTVTFPAPSGSDAALDLALSGSGTDAWGHGIDGDGDGRPGGDVTRSARWSGALVAGASRVSIMPDDATGIPRSSGFGYCSNRDLPATPSAPANPLEARVLVIAGGAACDSGATCASGQTCVAGVCQSAGVDANQPLVLVTLDLIGVNPGRLAELLASRYGVPKENLLVSATHTHAAFRSIRLFNAPYFDDRQAGVGPYETWVEDRVADAVGEALADMTPVEIATASAASALGMNRHSGAPLSAEAQRVSVVALRTPGAPARTRAVLVNYALHPVIMTGAQGINADFPGYLRQELEASRCAAGDSGCAVLYLQGGAGDINPASGTATDDASVAQSQGRALAQVVSDLSLTYAPTDRAQVRVQRRITDLTGTSACNVCTTDSQHAESGAVWSARTTAVAIGVPGSPQVRLGTLPGEFFSGLQTALMSGITPAPLFLGYTNGYLGYFPDRPSVVSNPTAYGVAVCTNRNTSGPTFFSSAGTGPTHGDNLVAELRRALTSDLR